MPKLSLSLDIGVSRQDLWLLLEDRGDHYAWNVISSVVEGREHVADHVDVDLAGEQELAVISLGPAWPNGDIEIVLSIDIGRNSLIETAMLDLRFPIGAKRDVVES